MATIGDVKKKIGEVSLAYDLFGEENGVVSLLRQQSLKIGRAITEERNLSPEQVIELPPETVLCPEAQREFETYCFMVDELLYQKPALAK